VYAVLVVLFDPVILYHGVRPQAVFGADMDAILIVAPDLVHEDDRVGTLRHDARFAVRYFAQLYFGFVASLDFDSWAVDVLNYAPQNLWLRVDAL